MQQYIKVMSSTWHNHKTSITLIYADVFEWSDDKEVCDINTINWIIFEPNYSSLYLMFSFYLIAFFISRVLLDIDECSSGDYACDEDANCTNTKGSHFFTCKKGYAGAGKSCQGTTLDKHTNFSAFPIATSLRQRNRPACARLVRLALASNGVIFHK